MTPEKAALALAAKNEGNEFFKSGRYEESAAKYQEAINLDPSTPIFHSNLCNSLFRLEKYEDMEVSARTCIQLDGNFMKGYYWLAKALEGREMYRDAIKICENALEIDPSNKALMNLKGDMEYDCGDHLNELMESCDLVPAKGPNGQTVLVSREISGCTAEDGTIDLEKTLNRNLPNLGKCAYPNCDEKMESKKLKRCSRCWNADYCSREHQELDWQRHKKSECKSRNMGSGGKNQQKFHGDGSNETSKLGWQSLIYNGKKAMKKKDYSTAISLFDAVSENHSHIYTVPLMPLLSTCYLESGSIVKALRYSYQACQSDFGDITSLVAKAKCHIKLNDVESAYIALYTAYNSHLNQGLVGMGRDSIEKGELLPLMKEISTELMHQILRGRHITAFPVKVKIASVPFILEDNHGRVGIIQERLGDGFNLCHPKKNCPSFPILEGHTSVRYGTNLIIFGGLEAGGVVTNLVRVFEIDRGNTYTYCIQNCSGDTPPANQGHSACVLGDTMYVFGGDAQLQDMYQLNLKTWTWKKMSSIVDTPPEERPDLDVVLSALIPFDENSLLVIGGLNGESHRTASRGGYGIRFANETKDMVSNNMHLYSQQTGKWKRIPDGNNAPRSSEVHAHNIGERKVLLLSTEKSKSLPSPEPNYLHIMSADTEGNYSWNKIDENLSGVPPSVSNSCATSWIPSANCLLLHGGRFTGPVLEDSVLEASDDSSDISTHVINDTELYCFNLDERLWIRMRVAGEIVARNNHTMNLIDGKLVVLGGSVIARGAKGFNNEREHVTKVISYDLDLSKAFPVKSVEKTFGKKKKRKGKKK